MWVHNPNVGRYYRNTGSLYPEYVEAKKAIQPKRIYFRLEDWDASVMDAFSSEVDYNILGVRYGVPIIDYVPFE